VTRVPRHFSVAGASICLGMVWQIRKSRPDIVHLHLPNPSGVLALLASGYRGRVVVTWHSDVIRQLRLAKIFHPIQRILLRNCAAIVSTSPNYIESSEELSRMNGRCRVIPYGIDSTEFQNSDPAEVASLREKFGPRILLTVGRLVYYKGVENAVRAMTKIGVNLLIIGDGPLKPNLQQQARELGVADRVFFLGEMQNHQIVPYYHACDVFILPSIARSEAFGIVQLEAMACGRPVVNTRLASGVPFVSIDGEAGITVPPGSPDAIAVAVNRLLDDSALRTAYGRAAMRRVQTEFSLDMMVRRIDIYDEVGARAIDPHFESNGAARAKF
jgi:glycosyltransferase involved in cell wall biosynthesis